MSRSSKQWKGVAYNLVMKLEVSSAYLAQCCRNLGTPLIIDFLNRRIEPAAAAEERNLILVGMCHEYLTQESIRIGATLSVAQITLRYGANDEMLYDVVLAANAGATEIAGTLRRAGPLRYEWLHASA